jgi:hypothetical protein
VKNQFLVLSQQKGRKKSIEKNEEKKVRGY